MKKIRFHHKSKRVSRSRAGTFALFIVMLIFSTFMALPMVMIIGNAFKPLDELWIFPPKLFPQNATLDNFRSMFSILSASQVPFFRYFFNTLLITVVGTAGNIIASSMAAFVLAKKKFPGSKLFFKLVVTTLMFNTAVTAIPNYIIMSELGWINSYWSLVIPAMGTSTGLYLMKQFMEQIPDSLLEAARIDGANQWSIFWRIVMPQVKPAWLTLLLLSVQGLWGIGSTNFIYAEELKTLQYALNQITAGGIARAGVSAAVTVLMMIVPIGIFVFTQSNIIETMSNSGLKE